MFCQRGLVAAGVLDQNQANHSSVAPNGFYWQLQDLQSRKPCFNTDARDSFGMSREIPAANKKEFLMIKTIMIFLALVGLVVVGIWGAYWWSNTPPRRPSNVSSSAVFLPAGHLGLPAPKHGTWIECWFVESPMVNRCRLTEMDGARLYEGEFVASDGKSAVQNEDLRIQVEPTSNVNHWIRIEGFLSAPLVFLKNGTVLIPKDVYAEGASKLEYLRKEELNLGK